MVTPESVRKRLEKELQSTQESVETISLWCLKRKDHAQLIVSTWSQVFKTAEKDSRRLSLFYLANDVCQKCRRKNADDFITLFIPALKEAILLSRFESIRQNVERMLKIWDERNVFDPAVIKEFRSALEASKSAADFSMPQESQASTSAEIEKHADDFNFGNLATELERYKKSLETIEGLRVLLPSTSLTFDGNTKSLLKSRQEGQRFIDEMSQTYKKWSEFVEEYEKYLRRHHQLIIALERAQIFYETQLNEAGIVKTAYSKFGSAVKTVREQLGKMQKSGKYNYVQSTVMNAPSLGAPSASGLGIAATGTKDKLETEDMDLDEESINRSNVSQETAFGGMKLATNQSFFNNPPPGVASNGSGSGSGFGLGGTPPKKMRIDPRQQKVNEATPTEAAMATAAPSMYPANAEFNASMPSSYPNPYDPRMQMQPSNPQPLISPSSSQVHHFSMQHHSNFGSVLPPPPPPQPIPQPVPAPSYANESHAFGYSDVMPKRPSREGIGTVFEYDHGEKSTLASNRGPPMHQERFMPSHEHGHTHAPIPESPPIAPNRRNYLMEMPPPGGFPERETKPQPLFSRLDHQYSGPSSRPPLLGGHQRPAFDPRLNRGQGSRHSRSGRY